MILITKDPGSLIDYPLDWAAWCGSDGISQSQWTVQTGSGLVVANGSIASDQKSTTVWLSGGTVRNSPWKVTNSVTTLGGRVEKSSIYVYVRPK